MAKVRRRRRQYDSDSKNNNYQEIMENIEPEVLEAEEPIQADFVSAIDLGTQPKVMPEITSDVMLEEIPDLDPIFLSILGDEPAKEELFGKSIHKDISLRWSDILVHGLKEDIRKEIMKNHEVPENLQLALVPLLNPEIKAAVNENAIKRDVILSEKQKHLACAITCISELMRLTLNSGSSNEMDSKTILKLLSDAGRLLCHVHFSETSSRRNFLLACLNKDVKDNIREPKRDMLLFGMDLSEKLKSMKAITRTGVEMRPAPLRPKALSKNKQPEASSSRALNWRGPPPPAPRRGFSRPSSTAGGRKQPPAPRTNDPRWRAPRNNPPRR